MISTSSGGGRGRRQSTLLGLRQELPRSYRWAATFGGVLAIVALWGLASTVWATGTSFSVPTFASTWDALVEMENDGTLFTDLAASLQRVVIGYGLALAFGVAIGVLMGSFGSATAFLEPQVGFLRYIPASALTPLFLIWMGIDAPPKVALIIAGTIFYVILMTADVVRAVPMALINAAYTLGAGRLTIIRRVIMPHSWPGIIDVARINLAAAWLMLVVAELLAAQDGLAFRIIRAQRFRAIDRMFALLLIFGLLGLASDLFLRWLRKRSAPWAEQS